jgi:hypothetical protein
MRTRLTFASWLSWAVLAAGTVSATAPVTALAQASSAMAAQTTSERGVSIKVTPKSLGSRNGRWEFSIVLDTHSADLSDDLTQNASLTTADGRTFKPVRWTGSAPGGHHRQGVLTFEVPAPPPTALELRIVRAGEAAPRTFRWKL